MPAPVLAAPLVIPFAEAIGVSIAALGMAKATDKVNEFIQENPEQSIKIFQMIMPSQGIANALKNKSSEGDEDLSEDMDVEVKEKPKLTGKEKSEKIKAAIRRARAGKGNYSSPDAEGSAVDIRGSVIREAEDMGLADKDLKDKPYKEKGYDFRDYIPRGAYKKKYADGGAIGIEVLFGPKRDNFRYGGDTMGGKNDKSKSSPGPDSSKVSAQQQSNHEQAMAAAQNDGPSFKDKVKSVITNPATQALGGAILTGGINLAIPGALDKLNKARVIKNAIDYARYVAPDEAIEGELENIQTQGGIVPYADGGAIGIEVLFEEKKPRKDFNTGGRATTQDFANALQRVSAGTTYQQQVQAKDYARQEASNLLSEAMRSGNQGNIQSILQGIGGSTTIPGMQFNRSGNRIISIPATGPGRDKILNAMANQMLSTTTYAPPPPPTDSLTGMLESQMLPNMADGSMRSLAEQNAIRDKVLAAQKAQEQSYFMTDPVTGKKYSTEAEAIDDLGLVTYNQRFADGGRVGLFMGGPALEGPALGIYNSMKAYQSFTDQEIANAIKEAGYELPTSSTPDPTPDPGQGAGQSGGRGSDQDAGYVDRQDYSFNKKNYRPGNQLEINPAAFGVSFPDQPSSPKREGIINQAIDSFTSLPTRSLSSFASPTTGGNIVGPAEQGFMGQTLDIDPAARTREEIRSLYDNYNRFKGRTSNFADARQKGKVGEVLGNIVGFASGIPFLGMLSNAFGPQGDKSLQSKYTVDGAGFGNTGARDEFGLATFDKKDGFLGLTGNTTRDYTNRMNERLGELDDFFGERIDDFDINNINAATFNKMSKINGFYAKQVQAYKDRLEVEKINREQKEKLDAIKKQAEIDDINRRKREETDAAKQRQLQIEAAAKAQEISRSQAKEQQAAIERDQQRDRDRGGGANQSGGGFSSGSGYNEGNYCFDPSTPIQMADGSTKKIKNIQLGDDTKGGEVTGVFQFKASDEIHNYKGVTVAGSHYVKEDGRFIMVKDSPLSVKIDKIPVVYSLDTSDRRIFINDIEFADYNGDGVAKNFLTNAGVDLTGFDTEVLRQVENRLI
jgi:hypothetical protein